MATPLPARNAASIGRPSTASTITRGGNGKLPEGQAATHGVALLRSAHSRDAWMTNDAHGRQFALFSQNSTERR